MTLLTNFSNLELRIKNDNVLNNTRALKKLFEFFFKKRDAITIKINVR